MEDPRPPHAMNELYAAVSRMSCSRVPCFEDASELGVAQNNRVASFATMLDCTRDCAALLKIIVIATQY